MPVGRAPHVARGPSASNERKRKTGKTGNPAAEETEKSEEALRGGGRRNKKPGRKFFFRGVLPSKTAPVILSFETTVRRRRTGVGHRRRVRQDTPALRPQTGQRTPRLPAFRPSLPRSAFLTRTIIPFTPSRRRGAAARRNQGGAGELFPTLQEARATHSPVCSRHALRTARPARRSFHSTPRVNRGYSCPSAGLLTSPGAPVR